jgi:hypothetical protein
MLRNVAIGTGIAFALAAGIAIAGTPLGDGDDSGFVPPTKDNLKCETSISKAAAKTGAAIIVCHGKSAGAQLALKTFDEEGCETAAISKYTAAASKVASLCPPCLNAAAIINTAETQLDGAANAVIFCDSTSGAHLGDGDDLGWVPADKTKLKCQAGFAKNIGKVEFAIAICHIKGATLQFKQKTFDEEGCENTALGKFDAANAKLTGCPACMAPLLGAGVFGPTIESNVDKSSSGTYCASPSGAFLADLR